jgi:hypothetical protein
MSNIPDSGYCYGCGMSTHTCECPRENTLISNCCGAYYNELDVCGDCKEKCTWVSTKTEDEEYYV